MNSGFFVLQKSRQHVDPRPHHQFAAPLQGSRHGFDAAAIVGRKVFGFGIKLLGQRIGKCCHRFLEIDQCRRKFARRRRKPIDQRRAIGFLRIAVVLGRPGQNLLAHQREEMFGGPIGLARLHPPGPPRPGKGMGGAQHLLQKLLGVFIIGNHVADAIGQDHARGGARFPARAASAATRRFQTP